MLLDPLEKQFNMPAVPIQFADGNGRKREIVCDESEGLVTLLVPILYYPQGLWEIFDALCSCQFNCVVTDKSCGTVHFAIVGTAIPCVFFGSQNEEAQRLVEAIQASEVEVGSIHNIKGPGFGNKLVKEIDIMEFTVGNVNESGDIATQVKEGMEFYR